MLESLDDVQWASMPQPEWNKSDDVPGSIRLLAVCSSEEESINAYNSFLFAVGNNHAGTYYPVVLATVPFLGEILKSGGELAQARTLDVLIELTGSFRPEPGYESIDTSQSVPEDLRALLVLDIARHSAVIRGIAAHPERAPQTRRLALELLETLTNS